MMGYSGSGTATGFFGGRPFPGTLRMASTAEGSYMAICPTNFIGFIPFLCSLVLVAPWFIPTWQLMSFYFNESSDLRMRVAGYKDVDSYACGAEPIGRQQYQGGNVCQR
jgi:hypothetical protein